MDHNYDEQRSISDTDHQIGQSQSIEDVNAHGSFHPALLMRLGLGNAILSPRVDEGHLKAALSSPIWSLRVAAVQALGKLGGRAPLELLVNALDDENGFVRAAAARALGTMGERTPLESLMNALHDTEWRVRAAAAHALGALCERVPVEPLVTALTDEDESVRAAAASSLSAFGERAPIGPLVDALHDSAWNVREAAALTLGELGKRAPVEYLVAALSDTDSSVREAVKMALQQTHPEVFSVSASSVTELLLEEDLAITSDEMVQHQSTKIERLGWNEHRNTVLEFGQDTTAFSNMYLSSPESDLPQKTLENAPEQRRWGDDNLLQDMGNTGIPHADVLSRPAPYALRPHMLSEFYTALLLFWNRIMTYLKIVSHMLSPDQEKESEEFIVEISVEPSRQPMPKRFWQVAQMSLAVLVVASIIFASAVLFRKTHTTSLGGRIQSAATAATAENPNPYPPHHGTLLLLDPLSQPLHWEVTSECHFRNGAYHVTGSCLSTLTIPSDFAFEVQMAILPSGYSQDCGSIGYASGVGKLLVFTICSNGHYGYALNLGSQQPEVTDPGTLTTSAIRQGLNQNNLIGIVFIGHTATFYVNHQQIDSVTNDAITPSEGQLIFTPLDTNVVPVAELVFHNERIWAL